MKRLYRTMVYPAPYLEFVEHFNACRYHRDEWRVMRTEWRVKPVLSLPKERSVPYSALSTRHSLLRS